MCLLLIKLMGKIYYQDVDKNLNKLKTAYVGAFNRFAINYDVILLEL